MAETPMRLKPAITQEQALQWLRQQAVATWGEARLPALERALAENATAMAIVAAASVAAEVEPLFP